MGTYATITVVTADSVASIRDAQAARLALVRVDSLMSNWTETSEVARINRTGGRLTIQPAVAAVIAKALEVGERTGGAYDITVEPLVRLWGFLGGKPRVPPAEEIAALLPRVGLEGIRLDLDSCVLELDEGVRIDLGGIAKGYGVDSAIAALESRGVADALVDLSGNMRMIGHPVGRNEWAIGVRDPRNRGPYFGRLLIAGRSIATAGNYEQFVSQEGRTYGHILDPSTGWPVSHLLSVTVLAPTALEADAWDTALFVLGPEEARRLAKAEARLSVILVEPAEPVDILWIEEDLRPSFELEPAAAPFFDVRYF
jgi:thiamine biosynthesis lipoprotein